MKIYMVGGAVRDALLGLPVVDRDYVVVGATVEQMLAAGFIPVGRDFPVFLHPQTKEEYALARTERKVAPGYQGFVFHADNTVTLEEDLARRDLTMNAIAKAPDGTLIDPFGGRQDIKNRILRHVSAAFVEDPVRILRAARFAARFVDFTIAPETALLMQDMVASGEVDALVKERVWQELSRGLMESAPSRMFEVLYRSGVLARIAPLFDQIYPLHNRADGAHAMHILDYVAKQNNYLPIRFASLLCASFYMLVQQGIDTRENIIIKIDQMCAYLNVPQACYKLAMMAVREYTNVLDVKKLSAIDIVQLIKRCDAVRNASRFIDMLDVVKMVSMFDVQHVNISLFAQDAWNNILHAIQVVNAGNIAEQISLNYPSRAQKIAQEIFDARVQAVHDCMIKN